eukprot:Sdes_comp18546_c0_seq1m8626
MGGPPPPPPPPCGPPALGKSEAKSRNALLDSIQKGTKLKKSVTVDKSAPVFEKPLNSRPKIASTTSTSPSSMQNSAPGGLFSGGVPSLKKTAGPPPPPVPKTPPNQRPAEISPAANKSFKSSAPSSASPSLSTLPAPNSFRGSPTNPPPP